MAFQSILVDGLIGMTQGWKRRLTTMVAAFGGAGLLWIASLALQFVIVLTFSGACGHSHSSDARLEHLFREHYRDLVELVAMLQEDPEIAGISEIFLDAGHKSFRLKNGSYFGSGTQSQVASEQPITAERLARYQELRRRIGMEGAIFRDGEKVEFDFETESLRNGESRKGLEYW